MLEQSTNSWKYINMQGDSISCYCSYITAGSLSWLWTGQNLLLFLASRGQHTDSIRLIIQQPSASMLPRLSVGNQKCQNFQTVCGGIKVRTAF